MNLLLKRFWNLLLILIMLQIFLKSIVKIKLNLKQKRISDYSTKKAFKEIDEDEYIENINYLAQRKFDQVKGKNKWDKKAKIQRYLFSKGYENELVFEVLNTLFKA